MTAGGVSESWYSFNSMITFYILLLITLIEM